MFNFFMAHKPTKSLRGTLVNVKDPLHPMLGRGPNWLTVLYTKAPSDDRMKILYSPYIA